jgi:hypothetical protein
MCGTVDRPKLNLSVLRVKWLLFLPAGEAGTINEMMCVCGVTLPLPGGHRVGTRRQALAVAACVVWVTFCWWFGGEPGGRAS